MQPTTKWPTGLEVRQRTRQGDFSGQTAGQAPNHLQGNVVILPLRHAADFLHFCLNNPKPCPLIGISKPGDVGIPTLANDLDLRQDIPRYRVFRNGQLVAEPEEVTDVWEDDLVTFVLGCSFTFEEALLENGFEVKHITQGSNVPMFRTNIQTLPAGGFSGPLVVTMRSYPEHDIPAIFDLSLKFPHAHGTPVYWGDPSRIGIADLQKPDYGDPVQIRAGEVPLFWACGVTPQAAIEKAVPELCITHAPGCMLVTDIPSTTIPDVDCSISLFWPHPTDRTS